MVSVRVLRDFTDLKEHKYRRCGDTFSATEARAKEIQAKLPGYVTYESAPEEGADLMALRVSELRAIASERGIELPKNAKKAEIVEALEA